MGKRKISSSKFGTIFVLLIGLMAIYGCAGVKTTATEGTKQEAKEEEWKFVGSNAQNVKTYYSPESINRPGPEIVKMKVKNVLTEAKESPEDLRGFEYTIQSVEIDCSKRKARPLQTDGYSKDGSVDSDDSPSPWVDIIPGSVGDQLFGIVCPQK
jgi:hypothetical protein